jgi:hypothetical protein
MGSVSCRISLSWLVFTSLNLYTVFQKCSALSTGQTVPAPISLFSHVYLKKNSMTCSCSPSSGKKSRKLFQGVGCLSMSDFEDLAGPFLSLQSSESETGQSDTTKRQYPLIDVDRHEVYLPAFAKSDSPIQKRNMVFTSLPPKLTILDLFSSTHKN